MSKLNIVVALITKIERKFEGQQNNLELGSDVFWRKYSKKRIYFMMSGQKLIHQNKNQQATDVKINVRASLSRAVYRRRYVPPCVKNKITSTQPGLPSSQIHLQCSEHIIYVGYRAGGLRWGIAVRTVLLRMI